MDYYLRNKDGIGYLRMKGIQFKIKMNSDRIICDSCNDSLGDLEGVILIPFMNSAYCTSCGEGILEDCRPIDKAEKTYQGEMENEYAKIFFWH